jgi:hypothetical protein
VFEDVRRKTQKKKDDGGDKGNNEAEDRMKKKNRRRALLWARMYPILYQLDFKSRKMQEREVFKENMIDNLEKGNQACLNWIEPGVKKVLDQVEK